MKNIAVCCDGTWNTPDQKDGTTPTPTNVVRLCNALAATGGSGGAAQHKYYHPGVGTDGGWWDKAVGGGTGKGLDQNIMGAYYELCLHYQSGDDIFLFGFSRGAYTVRSLAGFIACCGLLDPTGLAPQKLWGQIADLFQYGYRNRIAYAPQGFTFHPGPAGDGAIPIRFLGVWDTVGALGIPDDMALLNLIDGLHDYTFHDTRLGAPIQTARHAVALDERRASFQPTLWTAHPGQDARQVWFPGVHCDVGGGYREHGLADGALLWMIKEAGRAGLAFDANVVKQIKPNALDVLHDSRDGVFSLLPSMPRAIPQMGKAKAPLHASVATRSATPRIDQGGYRPQAALPYDAQIFALDPWNETGLWLDAGTTYTFTADGEWLDNHITCGPDGTGSAKFQIGKVVQAVGTALGQAEEWFKRLTGNKSADFRATRRHENAPWFCLMGAIANGGAAPQAARTIPHESFAIGTGCTYTPRQSGYFYAYANDAWDFYGNNRGHVRLRIT